MEGGGGEKQINPTTYRHQRVVVASAIQLSVRPTQKQKVRQKLHDLSHSEVVVVTGTPTEHYFRSRCHVTRSRN